MHELRVSAADKQDTIMHWALARLLMRDAVYFADSFMNRSKIVHKLLMKVFGWMDKEAGAKKIESKR